MYNSNNKFKNNKKNQEELDKDEKNFRKRQLLMQQMQEDEYLEDDSGEESFDNDVVDEEYGSNDFGIESESNGEEEDNNEGSYANTNTNNSSNKKNVNKQKNKIKPKKNVAQKVVKAKEGTAKFVKNAKTVLAFLMKHPVILIIVAAIIFVMFIAILVALNMFDNDGTGGGNDTFGYYDYACDFNEATIDFIGENVYLGLTIEEFVIGSTYSYIKDRNLSNEEIKAILIIIKTNALSYGNYKKYFKYISIDAINMSYISDAEISESQYNKISKLYNEVSDEIYVNSSYTETIEELLDEDVLEFNEETLNQIDNNYNSSYEEILNDLYNSSNNKAIYKISTNCTYYEIIDNYAFWWPIGSSTSTNGNIYAGTPSNLTINSYFGRREINGSYNDHSGIDIDGVSNKDVVIASNNGTVKKVVNECDNNGSYGSNCGGGWGNHVVIEHSKDDEGNAVETIYAHLYPDSIIVSEGQTITQGEKIAMVGNSGSSTGDHLHFGIKIGGTYTDPLNYVSVDNPRPIGKYSLVIVNDNVINAQETKTSICKSLLASGFSSNAVAGMLVNIAAEGSFNLKNLENCYEENQCCFNGTYGFCQHPEITGFGSDEGYTEGIDSGAYSRDNFINDHAGYGLIQWTSGGRKAGLYDYAKSQNKSIAKLSSQLGYLMEELKKPQYVESYKYITGDYSALDIATNFCLNFERPRNLETACPARAENNVPSMLEFVENGCK